MVSISDPHRALARVAARTAVSELGISESTARATCSRGIAVLTDRLKELR